MAEAESAHRSLTLVLILTLCVLTPLPVSAHKRGLIGGLREVASFAEGDGLHIGGVDITGKEWQEPDDFHNPPSTWFGQWGEGPVEASEQNNERSLARSEYPWGRIFGSERSAYSNSPLEKRGLLCKVKCILTLGFVCPKEQPPNPVKKELKKKGQWHEHIDYDYALREDPDVSEGINMAKQDLHISKVEGQKGQRMERTLADFPGHLRTSIVNNGEILLPVPERKKTDLAKRLIDVSLEELLDEAMTVASTWDIVGEHLPIVTFPHDSTSLHTHLKVSPEQPALAKRDQVDDFAKVICIHWIVRFGPELAPLAVTLELISRFWCIRYKHRWDVPHSLLFNQTAWGKWQEVEGGYPAGEPSFGVVPCDEHGKPTIRKARPGKEHEHYFRRYGSTRSSVFVDNKELMRPGAPVR